MIKTRHPRRMPEKAHTVFQHFALSKPRDWTYEFGALGIESIVIQAYQAGSSLVCFIHPVPAVGATWLWLSWRFWLMDLWIC